MLDVGYVFDIGYVMLDAGYMLYVVDSKGAVLSKA